ncbi:MAG: alkaline phosphatase [Proteobacteria bacterium]|nr:alkaline phosphatase [Pseudomonadota bacterium]
MTPTCRRLLAGLVSAALAGSAAAQTPASYAQPTAVQRTDPMFVDGQATLARLMARKTRTGRAKNVILFIGDGMGPSTVTAGRIYEGQSRGVDGESNLLSFERLPHLALQKTYSTDSQVVDSAASASAMMTGVKTRNGVMGLTGAPRKGDCLASRGAEVATLAEIARAAGKSTGAVTTARLTHATPAAVYAHSAHRDWEADADLSPEAAAAGCRDIARQLVESPRGSRLNLAMGGGRARFLPQAGGGRRRDGRDLIKAWRAGPRSTYVADALQLNALRPGAQDHVLGLFDADHLPYELDRPASGSTVPSLSQMTAKAIDLLSADRDGYFLMVEAGRIDHASHANNAARTLSETAELSRAVATALGKVDLDDTLVIVTADHSHGLTISGYPPRNNPILGLATDEDGPGTADRKAYTTLTFATGPGGTKEGRDNPADDTTAAKSYQQSALVPLSSAAHAGEDVAIYADGPQAHLIDGVVEQSYLFHLMRYALGLDRPAPGVRSLR